MRCRTIGAVAIAALLGACDRVTAPEALKIVDEVEQKLWRNWDPSSFGQVASHENFYNVWHNFTERTAILVSRDGEMEQLDAVVIERVFVPPSGYGRPVSRRSLVAWPENTRYGILAFTETGADESGVVADRDDLEALNPRPALMGPRARQEDWWMPRSGKVTIEPREAASNCPFDNGGMDAASDNSGRLTCNIATYDVHIAGDLVRKLDLENSLVPEWLKQRHRVVILPQQVKGIRFTVRCPPRGLTTLPVSFNFCNDSPLAFWRDNSLFSPSLGVDVRQMKRLSQWSQIYGWTVRKGIERRPEGSRVFRWTYSYPDGTVLERDSTIDYVLVPNRPSWPTDCSIGMGYGGRRQCLLPETLHPAGRAQYRVLVLDVEDGARQ